METAKKLFMTILRNKTTSRKMFRQTADQLASILANEAANHLETQKTSIETPLSTTTGTTLKKPVVLIPILRSGITMLSSFLKLFDNATVGVVGLKRDEETAIAHWYYENFPSMTGNEQIIILDPMIATGGTGIETLKKLKELGITQNKILFVSIVCAPEGLDAIHKEFPDIKIITCAVDEKLNDRKFIVPGLGDFGDRYFGTQPSHKASYFAEASKDRPNGHGRKINN